MNNEHETVYTMLSNKEAATILGISTMTLYRWRLQGRVPFVEYPRRIYKYRKEDIEKILKGGFTK